MEQQIEKEIVKRTLSISHRVTALFAGIVLPIIAFLLGEEFRPDWQSKTFASYIAMLLTHAATWPFWPIILFSMICLGFVVFNPKHVKYLIVRVGLYLGILWSFQYILILSFAEESGSRWLFFVSFYGVIITLVPIYLWKYFNKLSPEKKRFLKKYIIAGFGLIGMICIAAFQINAFFILLLGSLFASPFWCFTVYLLTSIYAWKNCKENSPATIKKIIIGFGYLSVYTAAWWVSLKCMLIEYSKLPTEPPDCYIATATTKGHRGFVKSEDILLSNGMTMQVNPQLRYLKCGELMIKAAFPKFHRSIRNIYDTIGPLLARCLVWPVLADIIYLLLKPAEWTVRCLLYVICGNKLNLARYIYQASKTKS